MMPTDVSVLLQLPDEAAPAIALQGKLIVDHNNEPKELELHLAGLEQHWLHEDTQGEADASLAKLPAIVRSNDGREVKTTIEAVRGTHIDSDGKVIVRCLLGRTESIADAVQSPGTWLIRLTNVKLRIGDEKSQTPAPPSVPEHLRGWKLDTIAFKINGRTWMLRDEMFGEWKNGNERDIHVSLVTATLSTSIEPGDTPGSICEVVDAIAALMTLALARSVRATKIEQRDAIGEVTWWLVRNVFAHPFSRCGFPAVDNWRFGTLRDFVEGAYPVVAGDNLWWLATLDMFMQVHVNPYIETKAMLLNVLADRIAAKLGVDSRGAEIDPELDARMQVQGFQDALHMLFSQQSARWSEERTRSLIGTVKAWNARPSFAEGIRRACQAVRLTPPKTKLLGTRHRLLHVGELHPPDITLVDYWKELEALVLLLMLRMLDYRGYVYAAKFGANEILLSDYLEPVVNANEGPNPPAVQ